MILFFLPIEQNENIVFQCLEFKMNGMLNHNVGILTISKKP